MLRGPDAPIPERASEATADPDAGLTDAAAAAASLDLAAMPIAGLTRGRLLALAGLIAATWITFAFARQIGAAGELTDRAAALRSGNVELETRVAELQAELELVQRPEYVALSARRFRLGERDEIPFTLAPDAPPLAPDAPGSAATAIGASGPEAAPIEAWLTLLFGPTD